MNNLRPLNKMIYILRKHGYKKDKIDDHIFAKEGVKHYRKGEISDKTLECVTIRQGEYSHFDSDALLYKNTIITFDRCFMHVTEYAKAFFFIKECYNKHGDMVSLKWDYISFDNNYDDLLWEMDRRLYKLYNEGE